MMPLYHDLSLPPGHIGGVSGKLPPRSSLLLRLVLMGSSMKAAEHRSISPQLVDRMKGDFLKIRQRTLNFHDDK